MPRKRKGERADGRIQIRLDVGHDDDGHRVRKYFYGKTRAEAERKRDEYLAQAQGMTRADISVSEWIDAYLSAYRTKVNSLYVKQDDAPYNRLKREIGARPVSSIREIDLQNLLTKVSGMSFSTCSKYLQAIKRVFKKARKNRLIPEDPAEDLQLPSYTKGTHRALSQAEIETVLRCCQLPEAYMRLWIYLMLFCGLRRGEMIALDWSAVDMDAHTLSVRQTAVIKGNKAIVEERAKSKAGLRIIPVPDYLYSALNDVPDKRGFVCLSAHGRPLTESGVSRGLERFNSIVNRTLSGEQLTQYGKRTDLKPENKSFAIRYHDLRHTYATLLYEAGVDVKTAAYLLGHADINVTMRIYTHLSEQKKTLSTQALTQYMNGLKPPIK